MPNTFLYTQTVLFQSIQFSLVQFFVYPQLNVKICFISNNSVYLKYTNFLTNQTVLFQTIQFSMSSKLNGSKYYKWFQVLQCITNNSIKNLSFVYIQLDNQRVLFQTIQFSISTQFSFTHH